MDPATTQSHHRVSEEARALVRLAAPIAAAQFGLMTMGLVDTAILGRVSKVDLAAAALGRNIGFAAQTLSMGLAMALEQLAAQAVGAGDVGRAWRSFTATLRTIAMAWPPTVLVALLGTLLLPRIGVDVAVVHRTREFIVAWAPGLFAFPCFIAAKTFLQAHARTRPALVAAIVANVVNLVVCTVLVRRYGALGSGLALSVASLLLAGMVLRAAWSLRPANVVAREVSQREVFRVGLPVGAQMLAEVGVFALVSVLTGHFGSAVVSANQIALGLASFTFMGALGVSGATAVRVGHAYGRVDREGARRSGLTGIALGAATMAISAVVFALAPRLLVRLFTHDPQIVALGAALVRVAAVFQLFDGMQAVGAGALRGAGDVRFAFGAGVVSYWIVGLPLALFFGFSRGRGALGMWWGLSASLVAAALLFLVRFIAVTRKPKDPLFGAAPALD